MEQNSGLLTRKGDDIEINNRFHELGSDVFPELMPTESKKIGNTFVGFLKESKEIMISSNHLATLHEAINMARHWSASVQTLIDCYEKIDRSFLSDGEILKFKREAKRILDHLHVSRLDKKA
ncbi:hypothetical protein Tco_0898388 [Tanacetum coccineum]